MTYSLGVDIGGTKIATVVVDAEGAICSRVELASDTTDKETMFSCVVSSVEDALKEAGITIKEIVGMGVGVPGKVDRENGIAIFQNNLPWANFPVVKRLKEAFGLGNIVIDNDVDMAAFAEWKASGAKKEQTFVYLTISTGIACTIIHQGDFFSGTGFAGEVGLLPVISKWAPTGIERLEKAVSGPAVAKYAAEKFNNPLLTTKDLFEKYDAGNEQAITIINEMANSLAHGIYSIICMVDPHEIVLGGGVMNHNPFLLELIQSKLKDYLIPEQEHILPHIYMSQLKGDNGVVGSGLRAIANE